MRFRVVFGTLRHRWSKLDMDRIGVRMDDLLVEWRGRFIGAVLLGAVEALSVDRQHEFEAALADGSDYLRHEHLPKEARRLLEES